MSYDRDQIEMLKDRLRQVINQVPDSVRNGSVQQTRSWLAVREEGVKMLRKTNASAGELQGMISRLK